MSYVDVVSPPSKLRHRADPITAVSYRDGKVRTLCGQIASEITEDSLSTQSMPLCSMCQWQENYIYSLIPDE